MKWIDVTTAIPPTDKWVIIFVKDVQFKKTYVSCGYLSEIIAHETSCREWTFSNGVELNEKFETVTHWTSFPSGPEIDE